MKRALILLLILLAAAASLAAERTPVSIDSWLRLGPDAVVLPAFGDEETGAFGNDEVLGSPSLNVAALAPVAGENGWRKASTKKGLLELKAKGPAEAWLAAYVTVDSYLEPDLEVVATHPLKAYVDGVELTLADKDGAKTGAMKLTRGTHLIVLHTLRDAEVEEAWTVAGAVTLEADAPGMAIHPSVDPTRAVTIQDVLDYTRISSTDLSPDGTMVIVGMGEIDADGKSTSWRELRSVKDGSLIATWRGDRSGVQWHPDGDAVSYTTNSDKKTTVWLHDLATNEITAVVRGLEHFQDYCWNPDGESLVYQFGVDPEEHKGGTRRLSAIEDRFPWFQNRSYLVEFTVASGRSRRLTAGDESVGGWEFDADGSHMIFGRGFPVPTERPYSRTEWFELDLKTLETERLLAEEEQWIDSVEYGPDADTLILSGAPSAFGGLGRDLPDGVVANDYGGQLYRYSRKNAEATPLTVDFDPDIQGAVWHAPSKRLVARIADKQYVRLAVGTIDGEWTVLDTGVDVIAGWEVADDADTIVAYGTRADAPLKLYAFDVKGSSPRLLLDPGAARFEHVTFGDVEPFVAELPDGMQLDGRVHYPRDYEPGRTYPVIVYYYGGTSPITRDFGGRYPKNVWAGNDYFVYIPNPSGATGYGQEYAARHVNDWGKLTAPEVIAGTEAFLAAYPDANPEAVGCCGASYGGFLTMYLTTQTDMFAAAISHAGISNISSYWGEGYWGYAYGARALANAFPWNAKDLYVEQSPLFHADDIHTPLLLLHGFVDTNVPKGESDGLYIALKMLGRDVEYVQVAGQDHHILDHGKRIEWNDTILAYFDWKLKGDGSWWKALYSDD